jgi:hypothetical protein
MTVKEYFGGPFWLRLASVLPKRLMYWTVIHAACVACPDGPPSEVTADEMARCIDHSIKTDTWARSQQVLAVKKRFERQPILNMLKLEAPPFKPYGLEDIQYPMTNRDLKRAAKAILDAMHVTRHRNAVSFYDYEYSGE